MMGASTRAQTLRAAAAGGVAAGVGAVVGGWLRPQPTAGKASPAQDVRIFNFLFVLEQAQAALYDAALRSRALQGELLDYARIVAPQEHDHVDFLRRKLGAQAGPRPKLDFRQATSDPKRFQAAAIDLEEATTAAYIGQGANLTPGAVADAARIVAVEARHAAWIRDLAGADPAPRAADPPHSAREVLSALRQKGYLR
jgi:Ferritin-like domain